MIATRRPAPTLSIDPRLLLPCPFCGGAPTVEADPWLPESVRIACGAPDCSISPRTEYLLPAFADELVDAWNRRAPIVRETKVGAGSVAPRPAST